jgi:hypothetical protein
MKPTTGCLLIVVFGVAGLFVYVAVSALVTGTQNVGFWWNRVIIC